MNQGKLEVVKQEMARVNITILGISELKWTGMGEINSGEHYIASKPVKRVPHHMPSGKCKLKQGDTITF